MKIGLLCEGHSDEKPLIILIKRIISEIKPELQDLTFISQYTEGSIDSKIRSSAILFFDTRGCDIAIFVTDTDGKMEKCRRIRSLVNNYCRKINSSAKYITGCPDPELEQWFLDEENATKGVFHLSGELPLPYSALPSKERFHKIIDNYNKDITLTRNDYYIRISFIMHLGKLYNSSKSFKSFYEAIRKIL